MLEKVAPSTLISRSNRLEHDRFTSLVNSMADGVIAIDQHAKVVVYNGAALNILDLNSSMEGTTIDKVLKPIDKEGKQIDIIEYIRAVKIPTVNESFRLKYQDESTINLFLSVSPVTRSYGIKWQSGYVILLRDITHEKSLEEERNEFISVVSHELRTPIAIAEGNVGNAQFVANRTGDLQQIKDALAVAHDQIIFLSELINDLSTLSRAERGKLNIDVEAINVHELVQDLATTYGKDAEAKGLKLIAEPDPHLEVLQSSRLYVREVLQNFITNSLKYTEKGSVTISAKPRDNGVEFAITDTGIGISHGDQEKIFNKFFRSEDFRTRKTSGTGLGLYITAKLAKLLRAQIEVRSKLNQGSTFIVFVPSLEEKPED